MLAISHWKMPYGTEDITVYPFMVLDSDSIPGPLCDRQAH